ncbi:MAG: ribosome-associated translation inhibitor RaiA [Phycisphaerales bacterium]|nr:ribosome-associated translation inhibitor RaiA [Phycisphaerales bacterium]
MNIRISAKHLTLSPANHEYIMSRVDKLVRVFDRVLEIDVIVEKVNHGFHVEIVSDVIRHRDFVANCTHEDLHACIDLVVDKGVRQLADWKDRIRDHHRDDDKSNR